MYESMTYKSMILIASSVYLVTVNLDAEMGAAAFGLGAFVGGPCGCSVHKVVATPTIKVKVSYFYYNRKCRNRYRRYKGSNYGATNRPLSSNKGD